MKNFLRENTKYRYLLFIPCYLICFFLVEKLVPSTADYWVSYSPLDDKIPFLEGFIIPYCLWYPYLLGIGLFLLFRDEEQMKKYVVFLSVSFGASLVFCLLFPNGQDLRPESFERQNLCTWLVGRIYAADTNTNVMPSMHVVGCAAGVIAAWKSKKLRRYFVPILICALTISVSTVFVKQHSVLDIYGGLALCVPVYFIVYFRRPGDERKKERKECQAEKF